MLLHKQNKIIELKDVSMTYDTRCVLRDVNLTILDGDFVAITGPNGGGKTTLLRIILRLLKPTTGTVQYFNATDGSPCPELKVGYLPQKNVIDSRYPITVEEVVSSGLLGDKGLFGRYTADDRVLVENVMQEMGIEHLRNNSLGTLSGGQMQRALLGRALISKPRVLVLDEPLSYVDKRFEYQIYKLISHIAPNTTIIIVSHEMTAIAPMATRHLIVDQTVHQCASKTHHPQCDD